MFFFCRNCILYLAISHFLCKSHIHFEERGKMLNVLIKQKSKTERIYFPDFWKYFKFYPRIWVFILFYLTYKCLSNCVCVKHSTDKGYIHTIYLNLHYRQTLSVAIMNILLNVNPLYRFLYIIYCWIIQVTFSSMHNTSF